MNDTVNVPREAWAEYKRSQIAHLRPYVPGERLSERVSISMADLEAGSPKDGDMIARNPANHDDQWLVAADYFAANFEPAHPEAPKVGQPRMTLDEYQSRTSDTAIYPGKGTPLGLIYCGLKLAGEAGEVAEKIGKAIRDDGMIEVDGDDPAKACMYEIQFDRRQAIMGELGDVLWYVASMARELGFYLSDIAQSNIDKLADRKERGVLSGDGDNR